MRSRRGLLVSGDGIDYQRLVEEALRDAVRRLLAEVAELGLPGEHYFYIGFRTGHPGVQMPRSLRDLYPEEMTIILQHQFWNLEVGEDAFSVELSFSASRQRLSIPFAALTTFADPSAEFALRFTPRLPGAAAAKGIKPAAPAAAAVASSKDTPQGEARRGRPPGHRRPGGGRRLANPASGAIGAPATAAPEQGTETDSPAPGAAGRRPGPGEVIRFDPSRRK